MLPALIQCSDKLMDLEKKEDVEIIHVRRITPENLPLFLLGLNGTFDSPGDGRLTRTKRIFQRSSQSIDEFPDITYVISDEDNK